MTSVLWVWFFGMVAYSLTLIAIPVAGLSFEDAMFFAKIIFGACTVATIVTVLIDLLGT